MSRDPYIDFKSEVEQNLLTAQNLLDDYSRQPQPSALRELEEELKSTLQVLETDLEDLDESVQIVETSGDRWGLGDDEVKRRRGFIRRVKGQVDGVRAQIRIIMGDRKGKGKGNQQGGYSDIPLDVERGEEDDEEQKRWEMEEQQTLMRRQDDTLGFISGTLSTLASQAGLIGSEVNEQSEMLDDLGNRVDSTSSKLQRAQRKMNDFIRRNEETKSGWCICILIFVLIVLLVAVILT